MIGVESWQQIENQLKGFVMKRVKDKALADDIVQDVFLKVHDKLGQLKESEKIQGWIYQITRNVIVDHYRSKTKQIELTSTPSENSDRALNDCVMVCLTEMIHALPVQYRDALVLSDLENYSQQDVAAKLNISYSGAKSRVQRARKMLKESLVMRYGVKTDAYGNVIECRSALPCGC